MRARLPRLRPVLPQHGAPGALEPQAAAVALVGERLARLLFLLLALAPAEAPAKLVAAAECLERADDRLATGGQSEDIAATLGACLRESGIDVGNLFAKSCYDQTLWARMYFDARRRGVALERMQALHPQLAASVYETRQTETEFRRELFLACALR